MIIKNFKQFTIVLVKKYVAIPKTIIKISNSNLIKLIIKNTPATKSKIIRVIKA